jgi:DeoR/GlpR family transcriptional regulator of sugar metabolism
MDSTNLLTEKQPPPAKSKNDDRNGPQLASRRATWVQTRSEVAIEWKRAVSNYAATHLIQHGDVVQGGPGTTNVEFMESLVARQVATKRGLDLIFMTTSLPVMAKGRDAKEKHVEILQGMQLILTGGAFQGPIDSLVGPYAVQGIRSEMLRPNWVFFGSAGLSFAPSFSIRYQFDDELATQEAYATRPTDHRVLLCDHTKLGRNVGWKANLNVESILEHAKSFQIVTTYPDTADPSRAFVDEQVEGFRNLLKNLAEEIGRHEHHPLRGKEFALRLVNKSGEVAMEDISLEDFLNPRQAGDEGPAELNGRIKHNRR